MPVAAYSIPLHDPGRPKRGDKKLSGEVQKSINPLLSNFSPFSSVIPLPADRAGHEGLMR
jgi:hypothetical protein